HRLPRLAGNPDRAEPAHHRSHDAGRQDPGVGPAIPGQPRSGQPIATAIPPGLPALPRRRTRAITGVTAPLPLSLVGLPGQYVRRGRRFLFLDLSIPRTKEHLAVEPPTVAGSACNRCSPSTLCLKEVSMTVSTRCPITRVGFRGGAKPIHVKIGSLEMDADS